MTRGDVQRVDEMTPERSEAGRPAATVAPGERLQRAPDRPHAAPRLPQCDDDRSASPRELTAGDHRPPTPAGDPWKFPQGGDCQRIHAAASVAAVVSSLPLARRVRLAGAFAFGGVFAGLSWRSIDATAAVLVVFGAWLLWEFHLWGGADATIAVGLAAMFPALGFVRLLLVVLACGSLVMLVARHRARTPLALAATWLSLRALQLPTRAQLETGGQPAP